ncbi:MAG: hypothetical protein JXN64_08840 [Spirochaetes bacterium]|nr:hypothetical protein [Spirochaetota bacterium]
MKVIIIKLIRLLALAFIPALIIYACGPGDRNNEADINNNVNSIGVFGDWLGVYDYTLSELQYEDRFFG